MWVVSGRYNKFRSYVLDILRQIYIITFCLFMLHDIKRKEAKEPPKVPEKVLLFKIQKLKQSEPKFRPQNQNGEITKITNSKNTNTTMVIWSTE